MSDFKYHVPEPPASPFAAGDEVIVVDSQGLELGHIFVTGSTKKIVQTDCGRLWTQDGNRWDGEREWPFPTIKHA